MDTASLRCAGEALSDNHSGETRAIAGRPLTHGDWASRTTVKTATSSSSSIGAWLTDDPTQGAVLTYAYRNEPDPAAKDDLHAHAGTAKITFAADGTARGRYYNDRDRQTFGSLALTKRVAARASSQPAATGATAPASTPTDADEA